MDARLHDRHFRAVGISRWFWSNPENTTADMELQIASDDEITLPDWIGATSLTLAEIGAVACPACMKNGNKESGARMQTEEMAAALGTLKEKNVLQVSLEGKRLSMEIDLDAVAPE